MITMTTTTSQSRSEVTRRAWEKRHLNPNDRTTKHGQTLRGKATPTYVSWACARRRCHNRNHHKWPSYGGAGVTFCERWNNFENFLRDMGERPQGTTLDRIDGSKGYEPGNCRWATAKEQALNKAGIRRYAFHGQMLSIGELRDLTQLSDSLLRGRIVTRGWDAEKAVSTPRTTKFLRKSVA